MARVNLAETTSELSELIRLLEEHQADRIQFFKNGVPVAELKLSHTSPSVRQPGIAKGKFHIPEGYFTQMDQELEAQFGDTI